MTSRSVSLIYDQIFPFSSPLYTQLHLTPLYTQFTQDIVGLQALTIIPAWFVWPVSPIHLFAPWSSGHDDCESNDQLVYQGKYHLGSPRESFADWSNWILLIGSPNTLHDLLSFLTQSPMWTNEYNTKVPGKNKPDIMGYPGDPKIAFIFSMIFHGGFPWMISYESWVIFMFRLMLQAT